MADRNLTTKKLWGQFMTREGMILQISPDDNFDLQSIPNTIDFAVSDPLQKFPIGSKLIWGEREMRYYLNDGTIDLPGNLYQMEIPVAGHIDEALNEPVAGATVVGFTPTSNDIVVNEYDQGYFDINDGTGEGYLHRVKDTPAITASASGNIVLYDPIVVTLGAGATGTLFNSPFRAPIIMPAPATSRCSGWALGAVAASKWGWMTVRGPASVLTEDALTIALSVMPSTTNDDGAVVTWALTDGTPNVELGTIVGVCIAVNADGEYSPVWTSLE